MVLMAFLLADPECSAEHGNLLEEYARGSMLRKTMSGNEDQRHSTFAARGAGEGQEFC